MLALITCVVFTLGAAPPTNGGILSNLRTVRYPEEFLLNESKRLLVIPISQDDPDSVNSWRDLHSNGNIFSTHDAYLDHMTILQRTQQGPGQYNGAGLQAYSATANAEYETLPYRGHERDEQILAPITSMTSATLHADSRLPKILGAATGRREAVVMVTFRDNGSAWYKKPRRMHHRYRTDVWMRMDGYGQVVDNTRVPEMIRIIRPATAEERQSGPEKKYTNITTRRASLYKRKEEGVKIAEWVFRPETGAAAGALGCGAVATSVSGPYGYVPGAVVGVALAAHNNPPDFSGVGRLEEQANESWMAPAPSSLDNTQHPTLLKYKQLVSGETTRTQRLIRAFVNHVVTQA